MSFTSEDLALLAAEGIADAEAETVWSGWPPERLLQAAAAEELTGPDLLVFTEEFIPVRLAGREITEDEARPLADLISTGHLVWVGRQIAATASGRELLARWSSYRPCSRRSRGNGGERS